MKPNRTQGTQGEDTSHTMTYKVTVQHESIVYSDIVAVDSWAAEKKALKIHCDLTGIKATYAFARVQSITPKVTK